MGFFTVIGNVGGIGQVFFVISAFILSFYAEISFMINAINDMYAIKTKERDLNLEHIRFCDKLKLITNCCPNKKM
jgi:hypothetical protein